MMILPKLDAALASGVDVKATTTVEVPDFAALIAMLTATAEQLPSPDRQARDAALPKNVTPDALVPMSAPPTSLTTVTATATAPAPSAPILPSFASLVPTQTITELPTDTQIAEQTEAARGSLPPPAAPQTVVTAPAIAPGPRPAMQRENTAQAFNEAVAAMPLLELPTSLELAPVDPSGLVAAAVFAQMPPQAALPPSKPVSDAKPIDATETLPAASAALVMVDVSVPRSSTKIEIAESFTGAPLDLRAPASPGTPDKLPTAAPERVAMFAPLIADAVRDVFKIANDKDIRFNVRPETLGPVAVTIERGEGGPTLRLGVETPAAVQAVRQAEPLLNDVRGNAPFVQVSVDLNSPDGRGKPMRPPFTASAAQDISTELTTERETTTRGRYA